MSGSRTEIPHLLYSQVGVQMGFIPEVIVRGAFLSQWIRENREAIAAIVSAIDTRLAQADQRRPLALSNRGRLQLSNRHRLRFSNRMRWPRTLDRDRQAEWVAGDVLATP